MKKLINLFVIFMFPLSGYTTAQAGDILIWNYDTLRIFSNPLELRKDIDSLRPKLFGEQETGINTDSIRTNVTINHNPEGYMTHAFIKI